MISIWYSILLSALCYNLAFLCPTYCAWAIVFFMPFLFPVFVLDTYQNYRLPSIFFYGFLWGLITYGINFIWFFKLLCTHAQTSIIGAFVGYSIITCYFALGAGLWFLITHQVINLVARNKITRYISRIITIITIITTTIVYFFIIDRWFLIPCGRSEGYPFLNPLIPLAHYSWFLKLCAIICSLVCDGGLGLQNHSNNNYTRSRSPRWSEFYERVEGCVTANSSVTFVYLEPLINKKKGEDKPWASSPYGVGQEIFHQLSRLHLEQYCDSNKPVIVVAPESTYRFALNLYPDIIDLWATVLPKNVHLLIGSHKREDKKLLQAVYWIHGSRIINSYVKKHSLPFVEKVPKMWRSSPWVGDLFLKNIVEFSTGKNKRHNKVFCLTPDFYAIPTICSEFFFSRSIGEFLNYKKSRKKTGAIFLFANDSWFCDYFSKNLELFTRLKSAAIGLPIVYVTHSNVTVMNI